jgi:5-methylcytosine-specific restriction endonuclease McrA
MSLVDGIWIRKRMAEKDARMARELQRRIAGPTAKRRAKKARSRLTVYERVCRLVDARDKDRCRLCGYFVAEGEHHHIIPRSLGGKHTTANLMLVHTDCHESITLKRILVSGDADGVLNITDLRGDR